MDLNLPDKLWQSANGITAFVVLQAIGYLYVSAEQDIQYALHKSQDEILIGILVFHALYAYAVHRCHTGYQSLINPKLGITKNEKESEQARQLSVRTKRVQIGAICAFGFFAAAITFQIDWNSYCESYVSKIDENVNCDNVRVEPTISNKIEKWAKLHLTSR